MKKNVIFLFLTLAAAVPVLLSSAWMLRRQVIRFHMQEALEQRRLHTLHLDQLTWVEMGHELLIDGQLFDVKDVCHNANGRYTVVGLFDREETELAQLVKKETSGAAATIFLGKIVTMQLSLPVVVDHSLNVPICLRSRYPFFSSDRIDLALPLLIPPPKVSLS